MHAKKVVKRATAVLTARKEDKRPTRSRESGIGKTDDSHVAGIDVARVDVKKADLTRADTVEGAAVLCLLERARKQTFPDAPPITEDSAGGEMLRCQNEGVVFVVLHKEGVEHIYLPDVPADETMRYKEARKWMCEQMSEQIRTLRKPFGCIEGAVPRVFRLERIDTRWIMREWNLPLTLRATRNYWIEAVDALDDWYASTWER